MQQVTKGVGELTASLLVDGLLLQHDLADAPRILGRERYRLRLRVMEELTEEVLSDGRRYVVQLSESDAPAPQYMGLYGAKEYRAHLRFRLLAPGDTKQSEACSLPPSREAEDWERANRHLWLNPAYPYAPFFRHGPSNQWFVRRPEGWINMGYDRRFAALPFRPESVVYGFAEPLPGSYEVRP